MGVGPITESDYRIDFTQNVELTLERIPFAIALLNGVLGVIIAQFALFFAISFIAMTVILLKMMNRKKKPKQYYGIAIIGLVMSGFLFLPLFLTPHYNDTAGQSFTDAFGDDWQEINPDVEDYFLKTPYSLPGYFLGSRPKDCELKADVQLFDGAESEHSQDKHIELYFDVYWPKGNGNDLPGKNSILIWIHGGGWMLGDKGNYRIQFNKYFAAQGYVVYDVQYGLLELPFDIGIDIDMSMVAADHKVGEFDIDDQIRHIGLFTQYIAKDSNKYSAAELDGNLSSVIVHGMSAGGQLSSATALAISSGNYLNYFSPDITIKGYVPYFPGNGMPDTIQMGGDTKLINPDMLVDETSPPCLIFHGTSDGLAGPEISTEFKKAYVDNGNDKCAILWAPLAGHASEIYFSGHYNMVFTYYMERFMYLCVIDEI